MQDEVGIPKQCPGCGAKIRFVSEPYYSIYALLVFAVTPLLGISVLVASLFLFGGPDSSIASGIASVVFKIMAFVLIGIGLLAAKIPKRRKADCSQCGWSRKYWVRSTRKSVMRRFE